LNPHFLEELLLILAVATAGGVAFERLRLPSIAGFLVVGALIGPGGLGWIGDPARVRALAELGVVFLLFEIGLELPLDRLRRMWRPSLVAGGLQVAITLGAVALIAIALGAQPRAAAVLGALVAMSSTALVIGLLAQRGEIDAPHGQLAIGILLFQDLCVVPFLLAVPILAAGAEARGSDVAIAIVRALAALALFAGVARFALPALLDRVARLRSREIFTMVAFLVVMGSAVVAEKIGLTLAVGAFIGGLVLSLSPYAHQLYAEVVPLRGVLLGTFFTAVGMLFDPIAAARQWPAVLGYAVGVVVLKSGLVAAIVAVALGMGPRVGILTGLSLAQTGEFSFVLAAVAGAAGVLDADLQQVFVAGSIATLVATPLLVSAAPRIASRVAGRIAAQREPVATERPADHVIVVGFGLAGRTVARVLRSRGIRYTAIDANAVRVRDAAARGEPVVYGDAARRTVLERLGVAESRLVVVAISDPIATRETVALVRALAPRVPILARVHFVMDVDALARAGASRVVVEELESTLELVGAMLRQFAVPEESIARFAAELREEGYEFLRASDTILDPWLADLLEGIASEWVEVPAAFAREATLAELAVRERTGASVVAVQRGVSANVSPGAEFPVRAGDRLLTVGGPAAIERLRRLLAGEPAQRQSSST
jgi:CPA2 family monovalent cation:H+ antiporter-2